MGRPSKHRLQTTASLRQRDFKLVRLTEDDDRQMMAPTAVTRPSSLSPTERLLSLSPADRLAVKDTADQRSHSFGSDGSLSLVNSDSNSSVTDRPPSVKMEHSSSSSVPASAAGSKQFTVSWQGQRSSNVLSGGYCCELSASPVSASMVFVSDPATSSSAVAVSRLTDMCQAVDVSPGSKWHIASDRDSPYVSVMALASSCHLFSESCPTNSAGDDDTTLVYDPASSRYWLEPELPDENVIFTEKHCETINQITAAYDRYVQTGTMINETLVTEMKVCL